MTNRLVDPLRLERPLSLEWPEEDDRGYAFRRGESRKKRAASVWTLLAMLVAALVMVPVALADDDDDDDDEGGAACTVGSANGDFRTMFLGVPQRLVFSACDNGLQILGQDSGTATYTNESIGLTYTANLVCVSVTGNTARFGYVIPPGNFVSGTNIVWQVTDNGPNGQGDLAGWIAAPAVGCDGAVVPQQGITSGDIEVRQGGGGGDDDADDDDDDDDDDGDDD